MRASPGSAAVALSVLLVLAVTGCGEGDEVAQPLTTRVEQTTVPRPESLTRAERRRVSEYEGQIQAHCVRVARSLVRPRAAPTARQEARAFAAADRFVALASEKPTAPVGPGQDLRLLLSDVVENLEGSNCDPRLVARLEDGLARLEP